MTKWISLEQKVPDLFERVILTDGNSVFVGWRISEPGEESLYYSLESQEYKENITHWMKKPSAP